jgi:plastocyanin
MLRQLLTCLCLTAALVLPGCGGGGGSGGGDDREPTVSMKGLRFHPATLSVRVGDRVTWTNDEAVDHNVTATRGARFHSRAFGSGKTYSFTAKRPGLVKYVCTLHPGMEGTLRVKR